MDDNDKPVLKLTERDGNAFALLVLARIAARENGMDAEAITEEAMSGDYDHLLRTMMKYFDVR